MATIAICLVILILMMTSYVSRTRSFHMFLNIIASIMAAALINIIYHSLLGRKDPGLYSLIYAFRILYHALLFDVFFLFALYTTEAPGWRIKSRGLSRSLPPCCLSESWEPISS